MDRSESLAKQYLQSLGLGEVVHEPDGNVPPDFRVGSSIAVEVRRLNQNYVGTNGILHGLEEVDIPLRQRLKRYFTKFSPSVEGESWNVGYGFRRPLEVWSQLEPLLRAALNEFIQSPIRQRKKVQLTPRFNIDFVRAGRDYGTMFRLGVSIDEDSGGAVFSELERNIGLCIAEKERKVASYRHRYPEWWLVLIDYIEFGVDPEDHERFRSEIAPRLPQAFDRLLLINPRNPFRALEGYPFGGTSN